MKQLMLRNADVAFMTQVGIEPELRGGTLRHIPIDHHRKRVVSNLGLYAHAMVPLAVAADAPARHLIGVMGAGRTPAGLPNRELCRQCALIRPGATPWHPRRNRVLWVKCAAPVGGAA
ncbi:hypothetical protein ACLRDC_07365 [Gluconacetobacter sacchari]|uniref:hypothetical protein n=1 Tax=Gluconacetobacter sacchari TaxID=92759 RepID=UPI0039B5C017